MWTDSHCHLHDDREYRMAFARAVEGGVDCLVLVGTGEDSTRRALAVADELVALGQAELLVTAGLHPHSAAQPLTGLATLLDERAATGARASAGSAIVAVGECGLDFHYDYADRDSQRHVFAAQIELARRYRLPLVVHTREAWDETFAILEASGVPERLLIHCFTGGVEEARRCLELGAFLSFSGIVTFKNAPEVRAAAQLCPAERLLVETDAPYLAPVPHRGKPNEPAWVAVVGEALATLRGVETAALAELTSRNAAAFFAVRH